MEKKTAGLLSSDWLRSPCSNDHMPCHTDMMKWEAMNARETTSNFQETAADPCFPMLLIFICPASSTTCASPDVIPTGLCRS